MRGAILRQTGAETVDVVDDLDVTDLQPNQVRVRIVATGVCHSDVSGMNGTIPQPVPAVLGHEGAGVVEEVGSAVTTVAPGDHVIVVWSPPCGTCRFCIDFRQPNLCPNIQGAMSMTPHFTEGGTPVFGFAGAGTWAEQTILPEQGVVKVDPDIPLEVASLVGCAVTTGVGAAINTARVTPGSSVVVFGCGGVGISVIQGARIAGAAEIVAVDLVDAKLDWARSFGATHAVTPDALEDVKGEITGGIGFDYAFEAIGNPTTMRAAYDAVRRGGTACIVGVGRMDQQVAFSALELFYNEKTLVGSYYGSADVRSDFNRLLRLWRQGKLDLDGMISRRVKIDEVNDAISALLSGEVIRSVIQF